MFIDKDHSDKILEWALANESLIKYREEIAAEKSQSGHIGWENGGYIMHLEKEEEKWVELDFPFKSLNLINHSILKEYGIPQDAEKAFMGWILMYVESDYVCKWHKDHNPSTSNKLHTRFNAMICKPETGGMPIFLIDGKEEIVEVEEREVWKSEAGKYKHSTTPMTGTKPRILLSLGYYI
tara:strand:- start:43 stop:585 length:543 start_codon:yes stop_codon:yes gene_type:complete